MALVPPLDMPSGVVITKVPFTVEEAVESKPPVVVSPLTSKVLEALSGPPTLKLELIVEEAVEMNPP